MPSWPLTRWAGGGRRRVDSRLNPEAVLMENWEWRMTVSPKLEYLWGTNLMHSYRNKTPRILNEIAAISRCLNRFCGSKRGFSFFIFNFQLTVLSFMFCLFMIAFVYTLRPFLYGLFLISQIFTLFGQKNPKYFLFYFHCMDRGLYTWIKAKTNKKLLIWH